MYKHKKILKLKQIINSLIKYKNVKQNNKIYNIN